MSFFQSHSCTKSLKDTYGILVIKSDLGNLYREENTVNTAKFLYQDQY